MSRREADYWPTAGWQTATPAERGLRGDVLDHLHAFGLDTDPPANGFVLVRDGYLVYEEYFRGCTERSYHSVNSVTKSVVSALIGIALRDGVLQDLEQPIVEFFPEIQVDDARKARITIAHVLAMTSGFSDVSQDLQGHLTADDPAAFVWRRPLSHDPGEHFHYDNQATELLSMLLTRVTGRPAAEYAYQELFEPLGIWTDSSTRHLWRHEPFGRHTFHRWGRWPESGLLWKSDKRGNSMACAGAHFTLREMAKLGWLYVQQGRWENRQIIPEDYVAESTRPHSKGTFAPGAGQLSHYGYLWWLRDDAGEIDLANPTTTYMAIGFGGQAVWVAPEAGIVVAVASSPRPAAPSAISRIVVPAMREPRDPTPGSGAGGDAH